MKKSDVMKTGVMLSIIESKQVLCYHNYQKEVIKKSNHDYI